MKRTLLRPLSWMYSALMQLRNGAYDHHLFSQYQCKAPVISVGNLNVGGTGKTPLVEHLSVQFHQEDRIVGVVSRGFKRKSRGQIIVSSGNGPEVSPEQAGDEPYMLAALHPDLRIVVDTDRVSAAKTAVDRLGAEILLMDDGFQHRALARDVNIVLVPASDILNREAVLPAGRLRESWDGLHRATHTLVTNIPGKQTRQKEIRDFLRQHTDARVFYAEKQIVPVLTNPVRKESIALAEYEEPIRVFALAGIGVPNQFKKALENFAVELIEFYSFPDHFYFPPEDQVRLCNEFHDSGADVLVMTAKDFVKWDRELTGKEPIYFLPVEYKIDPPLFPELLANGQ